MPEAAEIKLSAQAILPLVKNKTILSASLLNTGRYHNSIPTNYQLFQYQITNSHITDIGTKGKLMYWKFNNHWIMLNTYGMTGQWASVQTQHAAFQFSFTDNSCLYFNDPRHFGTIKFTNNYQELQDKLDQFGWDILSQPYANYLDIIIKKVFKSNKTIGELLLNQTIFCGCGNYLRAEALYLAKISPHRLGNSLSRIEMEKLCSSLQEIVNLAYIRGGATLATYVNVDGTPGEASHFFKVYGCKTDPLGNQVVKEKSSEGRTIHWAPTVQK